MSRPCFCAPTTRQSANAGLCSASSDASTTMRTLNGCPSDFAFFARDRIELTSAGCANMSGANASDFFEPEIADATLLYVIELPVASVPLGGNHTSSVLHA